MVQVTYEMKLIILTFQENNKKIHKLNFLLITLILAQIMKILIWIILVEIQRQKSAQVIIRHHKKREITIIQIINILILNQEKNLGKTKKEWE